MWFYLQWLYNLYILIGYFINMRSEKESTIYSSGPEGDSIPIWDTHVIKYSVSKNEIAISSKKFLFTYFLKHIIWKSILTIIIRSV